MVPEPIATIIVKEARKVGVPPEALLVEKLMRDIDPNERIKIYVDLFKKFLDEARDCAKKGRSGTSL